MNLHDNKARYYRKHAVELRAGAVDVTDENIRELLIKGAEEMAEGREAIASMISKPADAISPKDAANT